MSTSNDIRKEPLVVTSDLVLCRGERALCAPLNLSLDPGEIKLIKGKNGSGKSTLLKLVCGLSEASSHQGQLTAPAPWACLYWAHDLGVKATFNALENLAVLLYPEVVPDEHLRAVLESCGLKGRLHLPTSYLSAGQKRRILLARLMLCHQPLWLLDEVGTALDDDATNILRTLLLKHQTKGGAALLVTHDLQMDALGESVYLQPSQIK